MNKTFSIILTGVGGQGIITLLSLIDEAAFWEGNDVRSSELHGLSQRGGSVETHIRFGEKVQSPLVAIGEADLILGMEMVEGARETSKAGKQTKVLLNDFISPFIGCPKREDIVKKEWSIVNASEICQKELENEVVSGTYLLGYAVYNNLIPLKAETVLKAIENTMLEKYWEINKKAFELAKT